MGDGNAKECEGFLPLTMRALSSGAFFTVDKRAKRSNGTHQSEG